MSSNSIFIAAVGLGIVFIIGFIGLVAFYSNELDNRDSEIENLRIIVDDKDIQIVGLKSDLKANLSIIDNLNNQISDLKAANLVWTNFEVSTNGGFFIVSGFLCNTGEEPAYHTRFHIVAYAINGTKVIDGYPPAEIGTIGGKQIISTNNARAIYYGGGLLANWTITPEWTLNP
jgi:hypothetical protein